METPNPCNWSEIHLDIFISLFERLSFVDFQHAKLVCSSWYSCSKLTVPRESGFPWLMLFPEASGFVMYNPKEGKVYRSLRDFSGARFLANSGKWFLMLDSRSDLYIIDMLSENKIQLPPLESHLASDGTSIIRRVRDTEFERVRCDGRNSEPLNLDELRGLLWVDEKTEEYVAAWLINSPSLHINYCKKGQVYFTEIPLYAKEVPKLLTGLIDVVLKGYRLYISTIRLFVRVIDLSGEKGFEDVTGSNPVQMIPYGRLVGETSIAVTTSGEVLLVESNITTEGTRSFIIQKKDPIPDPYTDGLLELDSLGDEALLVDLGITVPANPSIATNKSCPERTAAGDLFSTTVGPGDISSNQQNDIRQIEITADQMDLLQEQTIILLGEVALRTSSLKRLSEQAAHNPEDFNIRDQIQKLEDEINEKKDQIHALEQQMIGTFGMSHTTDSHVLAKLSMQLNENTFEHEIKSADSRILQEQLQMTYEQKSENAEMQETIILLRQHLDSLAERQNTYNRNAVESEIYSGAGTPTSVMSLNRVFAQEEIKNETTLNSQALEIENLKKENIRLTEEKDELEKLNMRLTEKAAKE